MQRHERGLFSVLEVCLAYFMTRSRGTPPGGTGANPSASFPGDGTGTLIIPRAHARRGQAIGFVRLSVCQFSQSGENF